ncbi:zinc finger, CCHC-type containing protein, partial [Tanacetum coccineum]
ILNVYAPQAGHFKEALLSSIEALLVSTNATWIVFGDFNVVRYQEERSGCCFNKGEANVFNDFISRCGFFDFPLGGRKFTRFDKEGLKASKLDRFLVNYRFFDMWKDASVPVLPRSHYDHCPIPLKSGYCGDRFSDARGLLIVLDTSGFGLDYRECLWTCKANSSDPVASCGQHVAPEILAAHTAWVKGSKEIAGLMLMTMEPEIQRNLENLHAKGVKSSEEGQSVSSYVLRMKGYIDNLERLGHPVTLGLAVSLILIGLRKEFDGFVQNYNMHSLGKTVNELHAMLKLHEQTLNLPKNNAPALHAIRVVKSESQIVPFPPSSGKIRKGLIWSECGGMNHWKRELSSVLSRVVKKKKKRQHWSWW